MTATICVFQFLNSSKWLLQPKQDLHRIRTWYILPVDDARICLSYILYETFCELKPQLLITYCDATK